MSFEINLFVVLMFLGSIQGLFFAPILAFNNKFKKKSNRHLAIFILAFSLSNLHYLGHILGIMKSYTWLNYLSFPWTFLIPIEFYFFIKYLLQPDYQMSKLDRWLYFPFAIQLVFHLNLFLLEFFNPSILSQHQDLLFLVDIRLETILSLLLNLVFMPSIYRMIKEYEKDLKENYSEISKSSIQWIRRLVFALIGIWVMWALPAIYQIITGITTPILDLILWVMMAVCIYWIGYVAYLRSDIFQPQQSFPSKEIKEPIQNSSDKIDDHFNKMLAVIEKEKLFTNPEFDMSMLAEKCDLSANYLSQIINKKSGENFYSLINHYRLEEAKKILLNPDFSHYSILSIGLQAGFKSKSSFYKVFKEKTGMTPSQFLKQNKIMLPSK